MAEGGRRKVRRRGRESGREGGCCALKSRDTRSKESKRNGGRGKGWS